jgi:hypothetical protein
LSGGPGDLRKLTLVVGGGFDERFDLLNEILKGLDRPMKYWSDATRMIHGTPRL